MKRTFLRTFSLTLSVLAAVSCAKKSPAPAEPSAAVTAEAPAQAPEEKPADQNAYDGSWDGMAESDRPLNFTVEGGKVNYFFANYGGSNGSCSYNGAFSFDGSFPIAGKTFTATGKNSDASIEGTATGTFASNGEVAGTIVWKGNSGMCGPFEYKTAWKGKRAAP